MTSNPIYDVIFDTIIGELEQNPNFPKETFVSLEDEDFKWLIAHGLTYKDGTRVSIAAARVVVSVADIHVHVIKESALKKEESIH